MFDERLAIGVLSLVREDYLDLRAQNPFDIPATSSKRKTFMSVSSVQPTAMKGLRLPGAPVKSRLWILARTIYRTRGRRRKD